MIRVLALAAVLATSAFPVLAQTAPAAPPTQPAPQAAGEAEFEATAQAFGARMETMQTEMGTAITNTAGDPARRDTELDAIEARYQPDVEAFATALQTFADSQAALLPEAQQAEMRAQITAALPRIRGVPNDVRTRMEQAVAQPPASGS